MIPTDRNTIASELEGVGGAMMRGEVLKIYYLMILSGMSSSKALIFLYNLKNSDYRGNIPEIRKMLIGVLKRVVLRIASDPILYQRSRALAMQKDYNVFEGITYELNKTLDESSVSDIIKRLTTLNSNVDYKKKIAEHIINFTEEVIGTGSVMDCGNCAGGEEPRFAGLPPDHPPVPANRRKTSMFKRKGKLVGNPFFTMTNEQYSMAVNGTLPTEINDAFKETGIVVLENQETEKMMFLISDEPDNDEDTTE